MASEIIFLRSLNEAFLSFFASRLVSTVFTWRLIPFLTKSKIDCRSLHRFVIKYDAFVSSLFNMLINLKNQKMSHILSLSKNYYFIFFNKHFALK